MRNLSILFFLLFPVLVSASEKAICVANIEFQKGDQALGRSFSKASKFEIRIEDRNLVIGHNEGGKLYIPNEYENKYFGIKLDGKPYSSVKFSPNKYEAQICMWLYWPHATWQLTDYEKGKNGCNCF